MGCDIHGWIEVRQFEFDPKYWTTAVNAGMLLDRNYDMFGCLFGVRNYTNFKPIANNRGVPDDVSKKVRKEIDDWAGDGHSHSYITYEEMKRINWEEEAEDYDGRIHEYNLDGRMVSKFEWCSSLTEEDLKTLAKEKVLKKDKWIFKLEKERRKDARGGRWDLIEKLMSVLADAFGDENVRLVVWFDN